MRGARRIALSLGLVATSTIAAASALTAPAEAA
ncbi:MAG: hypothetical protein QOJ78_1180, partial [Pseudonocardiales bacterium]|nr:hypothetical protein [Pseudonocardiales bacterium]